MARYPSRSSRRRWSIRLLIVAVVVVCVGILAGYFFFFGDGWAGQPGRPNYAEIDNEANVPFIWDEDVNAPNLAKEPALENTTPRPDTEQLLKQADALMADETDKVIEARDLLNEALEMSTDGQLKQQIKQRLSQLSDRWLFSTKVFAGDRFCEKYKVKPNDQLGAIGREHRVPYHILMEINNIRHENELRAGETIKVINGPFHAKVHRSNFTLDLYLQNIFVKSFTVGLGMKDRPTPTGLWVVKPGGKMISPPWTNPDTGEILTAEDPNYPLGSRWISLEGIEGEAVGMRGFGIHGTKDPNSIGKASSRGCIRLHNGNAVFLYKVLMPGESRVRIVD